MDVISIFSFKSVLRIYNITVVDTFGSSSKNDELFDEDSVDCRANIIFFFLPKWWYYTEKLQESFYSYSSIWGDFNFFEQICLLLIF